MAKILAVSIGIGLLIREGYLFLLRPQETRARYNDETFIRNISKGEDCFLKEPFLRLIGIFYLLIASIVLCLFISEYF